MALTAPMSLELVLRGPVVHTACHTTLSLQPSSNGDLFLPQRATTDFSHCRDHAPSPSAVQGLLLLYSSNDHHDAINVTLSSWKYLIDLHKCNRVQWVTPHVLFLSFYSITDLYEKVTFCCDECSGRWSEWDTGFVRLGWCGLFKKFLKWPNQELECFS